MQIDFRARAQRTVIGLLCSILASCGGGGGGPSPTPPPPATRLELFAGALGGPGNIDGPASIARFGALNDVAADAAGNLYVADNGNFSVRKSSIRSMN